MKRPYIKSLMMLAALAGIFSCGHEDPETPEVSNEEQERLVTVNTFAYNVMNTFYLWNEEISDGLESWKLNDDPVEKVKDIRYKDASGNDIDRWTMVTDDIETMKNTTAGVGTTYGLDFKLYWYDSSQTSVCMVVTLTYPGSPAEKAGLKRGDVILKINGKEMLPDTYLDVIYDDFLYASSCRLTTYTGKEYSLTAVEMYEDPILVKKVFEAGGKKLGYLMFNHFTLKACEGLVEAGKYFRSEGIDDLILDLRYNGGGYVITANVLGALLAPIDDVIAGSVFETSVYNKILTEAWGDEQTCFAEEYTYNDSDGTHTVNVTEANPRIKHLYAIMTGSSASASESVLVGLMPYLDVKIFGEQSSGKYCSGIMYSAKDWYSDYKEQLDDEQKARGDKYADKWGIYVMIGRYADKNGNTPCMPDGFVPDYKVTDRPEEGYPLGDERETMLAAVLAQVGGGTAASAALPAAAADRSAAKAPARALGAEIPFERHPSLPSNILLPQGKAF